MLADKNPYIESAYQKLQIISQDKEKRLEYEAREKAIRDYNEGLLEARESGREEGREEGRKTGEREKAIQIVKNMFAKNFDLNLIAEISGLSITQIKELSKKGEKHE